MKRWDLIRLSVIPQDLSGTERQTERVIILWISRDTKISSVPERLLRNRCITLFTATGIILPLIGVLESFAGTREYYGSGRVLPIYIELDDGERLMRALTRERLPENGRYAEMCRRFLSDANDFREERIRELGITDDVRFENDDLEACAKRIKEWILKSIR